jgi:hypothetical protein
MEKTNIYTYINLGLPDEVSLGQKLMRGAGNQLQNREDLYFMPGKYFSTEHLSAFK